MLHKIKGRVDTSSSEASFCLWMTMALYCRCWEIHNLGRIELEVSALTGLYITHKQGVQFSIVSHCLVSAVVLSAVVVMCKCSFKFGELSFIQGELIVLKDTCT